MNRVLAVLILMAALGLPSFAQWAGRLSADDQRDFDKYYKKWVDDTRNNDRDDIASDVRHMQDIMARNNIPSDVPFDRVASTGGAQAYPGGGEYARLSAEDQAEFDKYYSRWIEDTRKNDRDDIDSDVQHLQEIMARYNIPVSVAFERIASQNYQGGSYTERTYAPPAPQWRGRLSAEDQSDFDKWYAKWVNDTRKNDRDDIARDEGKMQEIMARNNIPSTVHFAEIASNSDAGPYEGGVSAGTAYSGYGRWQGRLSEHDRHEFDEAYAKWIKDRDKGDRDDLPKDVHKMQEIMGRNGIPADVPYEQIASPGVAIRH
jgi:hypothetical protein